MAVNEAKPAKKHISTTTYVIVFVTLAVLTAIEITISQLPIPKVPLLVPLALIKASLVALFYMHLRTDRRLFGYLFVFGAIVGISLILSLMVLFSPGVNAPYH